MRTTPMRRTFSGLKSKKMSGRWLSPSKVNATPWAYSELPAKQVFTVTSKRPSARVSPEMQVVPQIERSPPERGLFDSS